MSTISNYSMAIFLMSDKVRGVNVTYEADLPNTAPAAKTFFKTMDPSIGVGDFVVVQTDTRHGMTVCMVVDVDVEPDFNSVGKCKWIVGRVERADFDQLSAMETDAINKIKLAEKRSAREELRSKLHADAGDELKSFELYMVPKLAELQGHGPNPKSTVHPCEGRTTDTPDDGGEAPF